jgi:histidine decarboxylase
MNLNQVLNGAVGPFDGYCDGYGNPGASGPGYLSLLKLETGIVRMDMDTLLEGIVSYDRAESTGTYMGQINMISASSFNGLNGAVWGYHAAKADSIADGSLEPLMIRKRRDGVRIPVYPVSPLLDAGKRLLGTNENRRFPLLPGAHVTCAAKSHHADGPCQIWCAIALAIAEDREKDANLFIEDCGAFKGNNGSTERIPYLDYLVENIAQSVIRCGDNNKVKYKAIFVGYKSATVPEGHSGCALTCAPYVVLAKNAVPRPGPPEILTDMTVTQWEEALGLGSM